MDYRHFRENHYLSVEKYYPFCSRVSSSGGKPIKIIKYYRFRSLADKGFLDLFDIPMHDIHYRQFRKTLSFCERTIVIWGKFDEKYPLISQKGVSCPSPRKLQQALLSGDSHLLSALLG